MENGLIKWTGSIKDKLNSKQSRRFTFWLFLILPALLVCTIFILIPVIDSLVKSFTTYKLGNLVNNIPGEWNNFYNYTRLFDSGKIQESIKVTLLFVVAVASLTFIIGMTLALILNSKIKGARVLRSIMMIPWVIPTVIGALLWSWIYSTPYGLLKYFVNIFSNGEVSNFAVLSSNQFAIWGVIIAALWKQIPLMTLLILAGLQNVPEDIMEAAEIDGASGLTKIIKVVIPQVKSVIKIALSMCIIENFKQYPLFAALTNGANGTTTLAVLSYDEAFINYNFGSGAAVTTIWMILMVVFIVLYNKLFKTED